MRLTLIGHMTVRIELDGLVMLTDPWFGPASWLEKRLAPRTVPPAIPPEEFGAGKLPLDALLISHNHVDHVDGLALALARRLGCTVIGSRKASERARKAGVEQVIALERGEKTVLNGVTVQAVYAEHPLAGDAIGFVVAGSQTCYFSGDTRYAFALAQDLAPFTLDVALVQAACAHYPLLGDDGMSLPEAATFAQAVRPAWTVPLHLHCAGKWLDRAAGQRIEMDNSPDVDALLRSWAEGLRAEGPHGQGLGVKLLETGEVWNLEAEA